MWRGKKSKSTWAQDGGNEFLTQRTNQASLPACAIPYQSSEYLVSLYFGNQLVLGPNPGCASELMLRGKI
jgi:hypothetical protein